MKDFGPLLLGFVVWSAACGNDADRPVSTTFPSDPPDHAARTGNVVFSSGDVGSATQWGTDDYELNAASISGDTLAVTVSYSGGCRTHRFTLVVAEAFMESHPVQLATAIAHDADGDPCEAYPTADYHFILGPVKERYRTSYGTEAGTIVLRLAHAPDGPLVYRFD